jgi:hypothetical protein
MTLEQLLPEVQSLPRPDKLRLIQLLTQELAEAEKVVVPDGMSVELWSPHDAFRGAETLLNALQQPSTTP